MRDRYRCVISHRFGANEAINRYNTFDDDAKNDDGRLIKNKEKETADLGVARK